MPKISTDLYDRLSHVRLLAMDVDGVLTDGGVYILENGEEFRRFNIKDGLGLKQVLANGIVVVWISSGVNESIFNRARQLGINEVYIGVEDKTTLLSQLCREREIPLVQVVYIGDDLTDAEAMRAVGISIAPADAVNQIQRLASYVTVAAGGQGAVREICDLLLAAPSGVDSQPLHSK